MIKLENCLLNLVREYFEEFKSFVEKDITVDSAFSEYKGLDIHISVEELKRNNEREMEHAYSGLLALTQLNEMDSELSTDVKLELKNMRDKAIDMIDLYIRNSNEAERFVSNIRHNLVGSNDNQDNE